MTTKFEELERIVRPGVVLTDYGHVDVAPCEPGYFSTGSILIRSPHYGPYPLLTVAGIKNIFIHTAAYEPNGTIHLAPRNFWIQKPVSHSQEYITDPGAIAAIEEVLSEIGKQICTPEYVSAYMAYEKLRKLLQNYNRVNVAKKRLEKAIERLEKSHHAADRDGLTDIYLEAEEEMLAKFNQRR